MGETDVDRPNDASGSDGPWDASRCIGAPQCPPRCPRFVSKGGRGLVVHSYDDADRDALAEIYRGYDPDARSMGLPSADEAHITEWLPNLVDRGRNFVAVTDRGIVGHAAYVVSDNPEPELAVFVCQDSHDRGIGTELCRHVVADTADAGHETLILHAAPDDQRAVYVYRELGLETVSSDGTDVKMCPDLTPPVLSAARPTTDIESRG